MADTKPFMEENDVLKQFMELLNQQNMREQSQDFMELFKYAAGILEDEPGSSVNKRDIAIGLLALHTGLRSCDIRALKFQDINWDKQYISLVQQKTGVPLQVPIDVETENAIIDYVLHERRECGSDHIFVTGVGPVQGLKRRHSLHTWHYSSYALLHGKR